MESRSWNCFSGNGFPATRRSRSCVSRRPCADPQKLFQTHVLLSLIRQSSGHGESGEGCSFSKRFIGPDGLGSQKSLQKLKLKLCGITHTIGSKSQEGCGVSFNPYSLLSNNVHHSREELLLKDSRSEENHFRGKMPGKSFYMNKTANFESARKSKRVPKRRFMDIELDGDEDKVDEEIHYLGRLDASKVFAYHEDEKGEACHSKRRKNHDGSNVKVGSFGSSKLEKDDRKKSRPGKSHEDNDLMGEEYASDDEFGYQSKRLGYVDGSNDRTPTHGWSLKSGGSIIEFPDGLPPAPPKKQKPKVSEVEQQLKRAAAAQRRRMQSEKAAREAEEEAIRKILGHDSTRKKNGEKMKKHGTSIQQDAKDTLGPHTVRWIDGPAGTVVIFSNDVGLPNIFNSLPSSYPPPREKCAGPDCSNAYRYRDAKLKVPLCSLHCYKAIHQKIEGSSLQIFRDSSNF